MVAAAAILIATAPHGPQVTTDSVHYLSMADNLRSGHGLISFSGSPVTVFPPGFSIVLAGAGEIADSSLLGVRILNALCMAFVVVAGWLLLRRHVRTRALRLAGVASLAVAPTLFLISSSAWSEPLFVSLVLAAALAMETAVEQPRARRWVVAAALLAGASFAVRYSGMWLIGTAGFVLLAANRITVNRRERVQRGGLFLLIASIVPALVVVRNLGLDEGLPLGAHGTAATSFSENASATVDVIRGWLLPDVEALSLRSELVAALIAAAAVAVLSWRRGPDRHAREPARAPLWPLALLAFGYLLFLLASTARVFTDPIGPRLLVPAFVPMLVVAFSVVDRLVATPVSRVPLAAAVAGVVVLWLGAQLQVTRGAFSSLRHNGAGYTEARWRNSELASLVRDRAPRYVVTNYPAPLYFVTSIPSGCWPNPTPPLCGPSGPDLGPFEAADPAPLAWFSEPGHELPSVPPPLVRRLRVTEVARVVDGRLDRVRVLP